MTIGERLELAFLSVMIVGGFAWSIASAVRWLAGQIFAS